MCGNLRTNFGSHFSPSFVSCRGEGLYTRSLGLGGKCLCTLNYLPGPGNCFRDCLNGSSIFGLPEFGDKLYLKENGYIQVSLWP